MPFQNDLQNRSSEFKMFLQKTKVKKKHDMNAQVGSYSAIPFYDSTLLDLGSAFDHYLSLSTCALVKQYANHFHA